MSVANLKFGDVIRDRGVTDPWQLEYMVIVASEDAANVEVVVVTGPGPVFGRSTLIRWTDLDRYERVPALDAYDWMKKGMSFDPGLSGDAYFDMSGRRIK